MPTREARVVSADAARSDENDVQLLGAILPFGPLVARAGTIHPTITDEEVVSVIYARCGVVPHDRRQTTSVQ